MSDILTRLILKTDDFDRNITGAKTSVGGFEGKMQSMTSNVGAGLLKMAGAVGFAMSAYEGFNKVMNSSQTLSDEYGRTVDGLKGAVDEFFYSLGSGDWTPFFTGLDDTIQKARDAYNAMDQLWNTRTSFSYFDMQNQAGLQEQIAILKDKTSTAEQKEIAKKEAKKILADQKEIVGELERRTNEAMQALVAQATGLNAPNISKMSIEKALRYDVSSKGDAEKARLAKEYAQYLKEAAAIRDRNTTVSSVVMGGDVVQTKSLDKAGFNRDMTSVLAKYQDAIMYNGILNKKSDEWLQKLVDIAKESFTTERNYASMVKSINRAAQTKDETPGGGKVKKTVEIVPDGSLAKLDEEITKKKKQLSVAVSDDDRVRITRELNELVAAKRTMEINVSYKVSGGGGDLKLGKLGNTNIDRKSMPTPKLPINKKDIKEIQSYNSELSGMAMLMGAISSATNNGTQSVAAWSAQLLSSISQAIQALIALGVIKDADTTKTAANTGAEVANAGAKAMSAHSGIPFVGVALGAAAVAAIIATMASMPKFADGGIIGGSSFFGDNLMARVNSGEMILNQKQQSNLFKMIDSGAAGGRSVGVNIGFDKVKGSDIYLALTNYMKKNNKRL